MESLGTQVSGIFLLQTGRAVTRDSGPWWMGAGMGTVVTTLTHPGLVRCGQRSLLCAWCKPTDARTYTLTQPSHLETCPHMPSHSYMSTLSHALTQSHAHTNTCSHSSRTLTRSFPRERTRESLLKPRCARFPHGLVKGWQEPSSICPNPSSLFEVLLTKYLLCYKGGENADSCTQNTMLFAAESWKLLVGCGVGLYVFSIFNH